MNFFNFDFKKLVLIGVVLTLPLLSINMQQSPQDSHWLVKPFSLLGSTVSEIFYKFSHGIKGTTALYVDLINIKKQSEDLHSFNNELRSRLEKMNELNLENNRLRELLNFKQQTKMNLTAAQVIGRDLVLDHNSLTINKGTRDGLKSGQAVITINGVLGYIFKPEPFTAHIMLVTDRYAVVDGIVQRTRAHGIVEGKSQSSCALKYVERTEDVKAGDLVVTGGLDNIFPKGFPVAIVQSVERKTFSVSLKVDLRPVVDPHSVEEVFVVVDASKEDLIEMFLPQSKEKKTDQVLHEGTLTESAVSMTPEVAASPAAVLAPSLSKPEKHLEKSPTKVSENISEKSSGKASTKPRAENPSGSKNKEESQL